MHWCPIFLFATVAADGLKSQHFQLNPTLAKGYNSAMSSISSKGDQAEDKVVDKASEAEQRIQSREDGDDLDVEHETLRQVDWTESEEKRAKMK